jgi:hypothetical protein
MIVDHRTPAVASRDIAPHLLRRLIQPADHPRAKLRRRKQILAPLPGRVQLRHHLVQVRPGPPRQPGRLTPERTRLRDSQPPDVFNILTGTPCPPPLPRHESESK